MAEVGQDALVLTGAGAVRYATGVVPPHGDASFEAAFPFAAVVTSRAVEVFGVGDAAFRRDPARLLADASRDARRIGIDRLAFATGEALRRALPRATFESAERALVPARTVKLPDEIALLREAQRLNEAAVADVLPAIVPGVREVELTGRFLAAMAECGVTACHVEPLWCVLPRRASEAPWTFGGGLPYRELPTSRRLERGDQVMIDTGMLHAGYMSDFGCTWTCGGEPSAADRRLRARWCEIVDAVRAECRPGATAAMLRRAAVAVAGTSPWPTPLYLAHGIGLGGVEPPFVGTDIGVAAEEAIVLLPGMVLVLEPYAWEEGAGGHRAEQTIAITATGHEILSATAPGWD
jgi:Xaa-Pro aminopeptidase